MPGVHRRIVHRHRIAHGLTFFNPVAHRDVVRAPRTVVVRIRALAFCHSQRLVDDPHIVGVERLPGDGGRVARLAADDDQIHAVVIEIERRHFRRIPVRGVIPTPGATQTQRIEQTVVDEQITEHGVDARGFQGLRPFAENEGSVAVVESSAERGVAAAG